MNRPSFDVLTQPWLPVIRVDGSRGELGIIPCLEEAHVLRELRDASPIIEFGLYRLLVAFVLDALILADNRPLDVLDLKELIRVGRFDRGFIRSYVEQCGDVFDLFHPERPFLQTRMDEAEATSLAGMFPAVPSGSNVNHWHHEPEESMRVSVQEAARFLTTIAPFMTAGGAGKSPSINGAPAMYALPMGDNLFETVVLNIPLRRNQESGDGAVAWRSSRTPGQERTQATTVEALTWRPRRIQLVPEIGDGGIHVREMKFKKGDSTRLNWIDANLAYRYGKDKVTPIRMREDRPIWRDAGPLFLLNEGEHGKHERKVSFRRPDVVEQAFAPQVSGDAVVVNVYGMRTDMKMKVFEWSKSAWSVPSKLGGSTRLGSLVQRELDRAEQSAYWLRVCIKSLYPRQGAGNNKALGTVADRCERSYWRRLELQFGPLMCASASLGENAPDDPALVAATVRDWRETIRRLAREQFEIAAEDMDADSDALERQVHAQTRLDIKLKEVLG